jgi:hypothetical protein
LVLNFGEGDTGQMTISLTAALFNKGLSGLKVGFRRAPPVMRR